MAKRIKLAKYFFSKVNYFSFIYKEKKEILTYNLMIADGKKRKIIIKLKKRILEMKFYTIKTI